MRTILCLCLLLACGARTQVQAQVELSGAANRQLQELTEFNEAFGGAHVGFCLYSLETGQYLFGHHADRAFVPASNVKLLTFYLTQHELGYRTPGVFYQEFADRLEIWGAGYPLALHPGFVGYDELMPWLRERTAGGKLLVLNQHPRNAPPRYGSGWSWDDWNYGFVYERSALPLYGNRLFLDRPALVRPIPGSAGEPLEPTALLPPPLMGSPPGIAATIRVDTTQRRRLVRAEATNDFTAAPELFVPGRTRFPVERALVTSPEQTLTQLSTALPEGRIVAGERPRPAPTELSTYDVSLPDTVFRRLLQDSDNFLAEQLILQTAARRYGRFAEGDLFDYAVDTLFPQVDPAFGDFRWDDGSGLSRYTLVTPRQMARTVMLLDTEVGRERLTGLLPAGGVSGTLERRFDDAEKPYVWAKTGSLSGVTALSGLVRTRRGNWLAFSFMVNNYVGRGRPVMEGMDRVVRWVYLNL